MHKLYLKSINYKDMQAYIFTNSHKTVILLNINPKTIYSSFSITVTYILEDINNNINPLLPIYATPWLDAHWQNDRRRFMISNSTCGFLGLYNGFGSDPIMVWNLITGEYHRVPGNNINVNIVIVALSHQRLTFSL